MLPCSTVAEGKSLGSSFALSGHSAGVQASRSAHMCILRIDSQRRGAQASAGAANRCYWKSASRVPIVDNRGYQMIQSLPHDVAGIDLDSDVTKNDNFGDAVVWLAPP